MVFFSFSWLRHAVQSAVSHLLPYYYYCYYVLSYWQGSDTWVRTQKNPVGFFGTPT